MRTGSMAIVAVVAALGTASSARAQPAPPGSAPERDGDGDGDGAAAPPILVPRTTTGALDTRSLGFELRAARPLTPQLSATIGLSGMFGMREDAGGRGVHAAWAAVLGAGFDLRASSRVTVGATVGVASTRGVGDGTGGDVGFGPGVEAHLDARLARIGGRWLVLDASIAVANGVTTASIQLRYPF